MAFPFTPNKNFNVTQLDIAYVADGSSVAHVAIYSDASGLPGVPVSPLYDLTPCQHGDTIPDHYGQCLLTISPITGVSLQANRTYWLVLLAVSWGLRPVKENENLSAISGMLDRRER